MISSDHTDVIAHPMFAYFARGKKGDIDEICRDFKDMLALSSGSPSGFTAKITPSVAGNATPDLSLTERQRRMARAAGMSYREYFTLVNDIPHKK